MSACPFPGLLPFQEKDGPFFFGRDREIGELLTRLRRQRFLGVIGVSGSGKSSLVHAGLKSELRMQCWRIVEIKPGDAPAARLAAALTGELPGPEWSRLLSASSHGLSDGVESALPSPGEPRLLIIVDQFEEIFDHREKNPEAADLFVQQILRAASKPGLPACVLLTMRTDFLGKCALFRNLPEALNYGSYLVPRLARQEQEEAIRSPLAVSGVEIDSAVVDQLLNAAEANRDELPVLQHLLKRLWEESGGTGAITEDHLAKTGGWKGAIAQDANGVLDPLNEAEQRAVRLVFQRITKRGTGDRPVRTPCGFAELAALCRPLVTEDRLRGMVAEFGKRDLLVRGNDRVDIPHECITWRWKTLEGWIEDEDRDRQLLDFIAASKRGNLTLAGFKLDEGLALLPRLASPEWAARYHHDSVGLKAWIDHSEGERRRAARKRQGVVIGLAVAALAFAGLGAWALASRNQAEAARAEAERNRAAAVKAAKEAESATTRAVKSETAALDQAHEALARHMASGSTLALREPSGLELAALLAAESVQMKPSLEGDTALRRCLALLPRIRWRSKFGSWHVRSIAFSPDGRFVAAGYDGGTAVMDAATGKEAWRLAGGVVNSVAFSPDGKRIATGSADQTARVLDAATGTLVSQLTHGNEVNAVAFSPDSKWVATGSSDNTVRVVDAATGAEVSRLLTRPSSVLDFSGWVKAVAFSPNGKWVAAAVLDGTARVVEAASGKEVSRLAHGSAVVAVAFSPNSRWVATGSWDYAARVMDAATGKEVSRLTHGNMVNAVAFSPDGDRVATGSSDNTVRVMDAASGKEVSRLLIHPRTNAFAPGVKAVAFSPNGRWVAAGGGDGTLVMEAATGDEVSRVSSQGGAEVNTVAFSPDNKWVASGNSADTALVMEASRSKDVSRLLLPRIFAVDGMALSPDGKRAAIAGNDGTARLIDVATGKEVWRRRHEEGSVEAAAFSQDGTRVATGSAYSTARVLEAATGAEIWRTFLRSKQVAIYSLPAVAFSPDGSRVAIGSYDSTARMLEAATGKEVWQMAHPSYVFAVAFSPDGKWLATGSNDKTARVIAAGTGKEVSRLTHQGPLRAVAFSPDGRWVATGSDDRTARVMEASTGKEISRLRHLGVVSAVAFSPDGEWVATASGDKTARVMEAATGRELNRIELSASPRAVHFTADRRSLEVVREVQSSEVHTIEDRADLIFARYQLDPADLIKEACAKLSRNLTRDEWREHAGTDIPYHRTCANLPNPK